MRPKIKATILANTTRNNKIIMLICSFTVHKKIIIKQEIVSLGAPYYTESHLMQNPP
jgi:hypothetical protein